MNTLYMAQQLKAANLSLIPIFGTKDSFQPKESPVDYVRLSAPLSWPDMIHWITSGYQLGIRTGRDAGLVVIDFNDFDLWQAYRESPLPFLIGPRLTVRTPNGIHLYIPVGKRGPMIIPIRAPRWQLRGDCDHVVAPHSIIRNRGYQIIAGSPCDMGTPNESAVAAILAFFAEQDGFVTSPLAIE